MKETIINNCLSQIDGLQEQKQKLHFFYEFERADKVKCKTPQSDELAKKSLEFSEDGNRGEAARLKR
jgi:hypothetical protein